MEVDIFMREALALAETAASEGEAPVGCVIVRDGAVVGRGRNTRERAQDALGHAELHAIAEACKTVGFWRLPDCALYVTLEPCPMCAGAVINARVGELFFGAYDPKAGACGSVLDLFSYPFNHKPAVTGGVLAEESAALLSAFFKNLRERKK